MQTPELRNTSAPNSTQAQSEVAGKSTTLKAGSIGVFGIVMFVLSAQAPLTGIAGAGPLAIGIGNGAGAPSAYLIVGFVIIVFAVGFSAMNRRVRASGAFFAYITKGLGRRAGAGASWLALLAYSSIQAGMYAMLGVSTAGLFSTLFDLNIPWWAYALIAMAFVLLLGTRSVEAGVRFITILVVAEFALIFAFVGAVILKGGTPEGLVLSASFSPSVFLQGAPGVAIMFAVASMFGFEQTAIYSSEAKDPVKTVARATYISVAIIALFFALVMWVLVSYYGYSSVIDAAFAALDSPDPTQFLMAPIADALGPWAGLLGQIFMSTSLLIGIIAFHNTVNRYLHALGLARALPGLLSHTNRHSAPYVAAFVQTAIAFAIVIPFAILRLDPVLTLFTWFSGLAVAALLTLYVLASIAIFRYLRSRGVTASIWESTLAPALATLGFGFFLYLVVSQFTELIGGSLGVALALLAAVPVAFIVGIITDRNASGTLDENMLLAESEQPTQSSY